MPRPLESYSYHNIRRAATFFDTEVMRVVNKHAKTTRWSYSYHNTRRHGHILTEAMCVANKPSKLFHTRRSTHRDRTRVRLVLPNLIPQQCQVDERRTIIKREKLTTHSTCCESDYSGFTYTFYCPMDAQEWFEQWCLWRTSAKARDRAVRTLSRAPNLVKTSHHTNTALYTHCSVSKPHDEREKRVSSLLIAFTYHIPY